ncbi:helix-turn-helix domain-containing protein [Carboxylicivirga linearis]|uniref:Helix-turn-helix transcriptional regulator n=1 Tax=Carboxylicivirga linearis TaxID=1628157 RepID=A0ABS5JWY1_9BACT|nr:AraC family transcriptional regulator [Carboxylicivirga linearis]MBS2099393.1 helix-turn-helix transcriptional regulator [Carboxylicivirga linearis]
MTERSLLNILLSKYFIGIFVGLTVILIVVISYFSSIKDLVIFPSEEEYTFGGYTDKVNQGASEIIELTISDSTLLFHFRLKEGFFSPYAGFSISRKDGKSIDASEYNQISLCVLGENIKRLGVGVYGVLNDADEEGENLFHSYLNISDVKEIYHISKSQLQHPDWWEDLYQITDSENDEPDFSRIMHLNIGSAYSPDINTDKTIEIYTIAFTRDNSRLFTLLAIVYIVLIVSLFVFFYIRLYINKKGDSVTVTYQPVELKKENAVEDDICLGFINLHFHDNDLNLDVVAEKTGVSQRKITNLINNRFNCNFKSYINRIRINEAKRLLSETDMNIGEIAYKVGFNNQSHFNRVFKAENNISPSEYRENQ